VIQEFTTAYSDGVIYPADWVSLSTTAPASQGSSGVIAGETLTAFDYVECTLWDADNLGCGTLCLGVVMGKSIGSVSNWENVTADVLADGDICTIQSKGVHPQGSQADTGLLGDYLVASTTASEPLNAASAAITISAILQPRGVVMVDSTTYQRAAAADTHGSVVYVDC
jgi:hypothetical protein